MRNFLKRQWAQITTKLGSIVVLVAGAVSQIPASLAQFDPRLAPIIAAAGVVLVIFQETTDHGE